MYCPLACAASWHEIPTGLASLHAAGECLRACCSVDVVQLQAQTVLPTRLCLLCYLGRMQGEVFPICHILRQWETVASHSPDACGTMPTHIHTIKLDDSKACVSYDWYHHIHVAWFSRTHDSTLQQRNPFLLDIGSFISLIAFQA